MLDGLRAFSKTWIAKILLALLIVSFGAFGINNVITDLGSNTIARVGNEEITSRDFQRAYQTQLNAAAQQLGTIPTREQAVALGLPSAAISRLAAEATVDRLADTFGLGVSEDRMSRMLREDPAFAGTLGGFNPEAFSLVLQQNGLTESEYFGAQADSARRQQVAMGLFGDTVVPKTAQELFSRYTSDRRTIDYFVVNEQSIPPVAEPTQEQLASYLAENQQKFRTVETRNVDLLAFSPEVLAKSVTISDEEIAAEYERSKERLNTPERRLIRQVALPDASAVALFETGKAEGRGFGELVTQSGLSVTDLGFLAASQVTDPGLSAAAFGLQQGEFVIIDGATGKRAVTVAAIEPGHQIPLEDAREDIASKLALDQAKRDYAEILDQIEELRAAFEPMQKIAERYNLELRTLDVTATGGALSAVAEIPEAERARVAAGIFAAQEGKLAPSIRLSANHNVWIDLKSIEPARDQTLDEVREAVAAAWKQEETDKAIASEVERIEEQLDTGTELADIATSLNQFPQLSQPFDRSGDGTSVIDAAVAAAAFAGGAEHHGTAMNADGDYVVFDVVEITPAPGEIDPNLANYVTETTRDIIYSEFISGLRDEAGLRINQQALNQILDLTTAGN